MPVRCWLPWQLSVGAKEEEWWTLSSGYRHVELELQRHSHESGYLQNGLFLCLSCTSWWKLSMPRASLSITLTSVTLNWAWTISVWIQIAFLNKSLCPLLWETLFQRQCLQSSCPLRSDSSSTPASWLRYFGLCTHLARSSLHCIRQGRTEPLWAGMVTIPKWSQSLGSRGTQEGVSGSSNSLEFESCQRYWPIRA